MTQSVEDLHKQEQKRLRRQILKMEIFYYGSWLNSQQHLISEGISSINIYYQENVVA